MFVYQITLKLTGQQLVERHFESKGERAQFINDFENDMLSKNVKFKQKFDHFVFITFSLIKDGRDIGSLTIYK